MRFRGWLLAFLLLPGLLCAQGQLAFEAEVLDFELSRLDGQADTLVWNVRGSYYFSNLHDAAISREIWFPVPSSDSIGVAEKVEVALLEPADSMSVELTCQTDDGFTFRLDLPQRSFVGVHIKYDQKISGKEARYVLLTANAWGRPLPSCEITLFLEGGLELRDYPLPDPVIVPSSLGDTYHWQITGFRPETDLIVNLVE
ncbi:MAG TPA: hypothetical protein PLG20_05540 [Candidatus Syntrophosphaera sp.]|nr:hypothetical protein [Candidatus Syntrophosphaera sp.]